MPNNLKNMIKHETKEEIKNKTVKSVALFPNEKTFSSIVKFILLCVKSIIVALICATIILVISLYVAEYFKMDVTLNNLLNICILITAISSFIIAVIRKKNYTALLLFIYFIMFRLVHKSEDLNIINYISLNFIILFYIISLCLYYIAINAFIIISKKRNL